MFRAFFGEHISITRIAADKVRLPLKEAIWSDDSSFLEMFSVVFLMHIIVSFLLLDIFFSKN